MTTSVAFREYEPDEAAEDEGIKPMRIGFVHLNLGIGGAERWLVDAAVALQNRGHTVQIFTNYHEDGENGRSFEETRDGTLEVHVLGNWLFPESIFGGRLMALCATLRQFHLALAMLWAVSLHFSGFYLHWLVFSKDKPYESSSDWSWRRQLEPFDVISLDQLPAASPILRFLAPVVYYCHFPDLLLAKHGETGLLRKIYRWPLDTFEALTTWSADKPVVNSRFTYHVFRHTFPNCGTPTVVEPAVDTDHFVPVSDDPLLGDSLLEGSRLVSINRFEDAKNIQLAVKAFVRMKSSSYTLVLAGGYDPLNDNNAKTLANLVRLCDELGLSHVTVNYAKDAEAPRITRRKPRVLFLLNINDDLKHSLLVSSSTHCVLYTPPREHFGIVPVEAMSSGRIVLGVNFGGPLETINDEGLDSPDTTGFLRPSDPDEWASVLDHVAALPSVARSIIGLRARQRAVDEYSVGRMGEKLELAADNARFNGRVWVFVILLLFSMFPVFVYVINTLSRMTEALFGVRIVPE